MRKVLLILPFIMYSIFANGRVAYEITSDNLIVEKDSSYYHFVGNVEMHYHGTLCKSDSVVIKNDTLYLYSVNVETDSLLIIANRGKVKDSLFADYMRWYNDSVFMRKVTTGKGDYIFYGEFLNGYKRRYKLYGKACMVNEKNDTIKSDTIIIDDNLVFKWNVSGKWGNGRFCGDSLYVDTMGYLVLFEGSFYTKRDSLSGFKIELFGDSKKVDSVYSVGESHLVSIEDKGKHIIDADSIKFYFSSDSLRKILFNGNIKGRYIKE